MRMASGGVVVRLQNLPWSASAPDVRDFFRGLEIPNGGVRIIGGDDGDCFVSFLNNSDARNALMKDRSYLNDQQVTLQPSRYVNCLDSMGFKRFLFIKYV